MAATIVAKWFQENKNIPTSVKNFIFIFIFSKQLHSKQVCREVEGDITYWGFFFFRFSSGDNLRLGSLPPPTMRNQEWKEMEII